MSIARGEGPRLGEEEFRPGHQVQDTLFTVLARGGLGHREAVADPGIETRVVLAKKFQNAIRYNLIALR